MKEQLEQQKIFTDSVNDVRVPSCGSGNFYNSVNSETFFLDQLFKVQDTSPESYCGIMHHFRRSDRTSWSPNEAKHENYPESLYAMSNKRSKKQQIVIY